MSKTRIPFTAEHAAASLLSSQDPNAGVDAPVGEYKFEVKTAEVVDTKDGVGRVLNLVVTIAEGAFKGRSFPKNQSLGKSEGAANTRTRLYRALGTPELDQPANYEAMWNDIDSVRNTLIGKTFKAMLSYEKDEHTQKVFGRVNL